MEFFVFKKKLKISKKFKCIMVSLCCCLITSGVAISVGKNTDVIANAVNLANDVMKTVKN